MNPAKDQIVGNCFRTFQANKKQILINVNRHVLYGIVKNRVSDHTMVMGGWNDITD